MSSGSKLRIGIVGACARGGSFKAGCDASGCILVAAVCDCNEAGLPAAQQRLGAAAAYASYEEMLEKTQLDAVIVGTPMHLHVPMSIQALEKGLHVLSEVTAGVSVDECKDLVRACQKSKGIYMMAENYTYTKPNQLVKQLVEQGAFGTPYYAEGEYLHQLRDMIENETPWRRQWQAGIDGITYGTHSLGPILQWMPGDRVKRVCCEGTGVHHADPSGKPYCQASSTMLGKTEKGALIKIRVDLLSERPHAMNNYQLQGTDGAYESSRGGPHDRDKIWFRRLSEKPEWVDLRSLQAIDELKKKYMPKMWLEMEAAARKAGHGGGDFFEILDFVDAVRGQRPPVIGIHEAMDMTLPGLVSQQSIRQEGRWLDVPDSRDW